MQSMVDKAQIIFLHFKEHLKQKDIALQLNVSESYITQVIQKDKRYFKEKEKRRIKNIKKHNKQCKERTYKRREEQRQLKAYMDLQHNQAVKELSNEVRITTDNNRRCVKVDPNSISAKYKNFGCRAV